MTTPTAPGRTHGRYVGQSPGLVPVGEQIYMVIKKIIPPKFHSNSIGLDTIRPASWHRGLVAIA